MNHIGLCLEPLDVLFFRDGRPFGAAMRGESGLPTPQTVLGALRSALLERFCPAFAAFRHARVRPRKWDEVCQMADVPSWLRSLGVRGPWLARVGAGGKLDVLVQAPAALHQRKREQDGVLCRLRPLHANQLPGWNLASSSEQQGLRPLWQTSREATETAKGYLTSAGLATFLNDGEPDKELLLKDEDLFTLDHRTGIGVHADRLTAEESQIYGASFLALRPLYTARELHEQPRPLPQVVLYAEVTGAERAPSDALAELGALPLGGEGRRATVRPITPFRWPEVATPAAKQKPLLLLTTPGLFDARWRPRCLDGFLAAAAVPTPLAVSGWDLARGGPKPTRFAAPAGSVYFLDSLPPDLPECLSDREEDRVQGWGCYGKGVWTDG